MIIDTDEYIDAVTAAKMLEVSRPTMSYHCKVGNFPGTIRIGHYWLIPRKAVEEYVRRKPGPERKS
ncbi:MAG: helix-turn-helix domain-containing protein [Synergistaceae bacterium]|nr:helix-turn-helix domain-containing protein [Synergistaceae bacterium]